MTGKRALRVIVTQSAARAIIEQAEYFAERENQLLADRWEAAIQTFLEQLPRAAGLGSRCEFRHTELRHLRRIAVPGFPRHLIFYQYLPGDGIVRVVTVVHGARDIEALLAKQTTQ